MGMISTDRYVEFLHSRVQLQIKWEGKEIGSDIENSEVGT